MCTQRLSSSKREEDDGGRLGWGEVGSNFEEAKLDEKMSHKMRAAVESAIAEYDDAVELRDKQHFAVVAIERTRMYLQATTELRRRSAFADDDDDDSTCGSTKNHFFCVMYASY